MISSGPTARRKRKQPTDSSKSSALTALPLMSSPKFEVHAEITVRLTQQDVDDIMVSALEGGICYWSDCAEVVGCYLSEYASGQISRGGKLKIHVDEPFDEANTEWYELDMEKFAQGFRLWLENGGDRYGAVSNGEVDTCEIDGEMADLIIQYALFGEVVYG